MEFPQYCVRFSVFPMFYAIDTEITVEIIWNKTLANQISSLIISTDISEEDGNRRVAILRKTTPQYAALRRNI